MADGQLNTINMSDKIKPSEVSEGLLRQLNQVVSSEQFDEVGTVLTVGDGVARIYGLNNAEANELLEFENGTMAIVMNLEEDNVGCVLLGPTAGIKDRPLGAHTALPLSVSMTTSWAAWSTPWVSPLTAWVR